MSIYFGNKKVNYLYVGLTPVIKGYVGTHLFYDGDNTDIDITYKKYILNTKFSRLYNTEEKPIKSAILKGNTDENLQSVKMPTLKIAGKNLFDKSKIKEHYGFDLDSVVNKYNWFVSDYIPVQPNTDYKIIKTSRIHIYDENKTLIDYPKPTDGIFTTPTNAAFLRINGQLVELDTWQVEEGSITTEYESYKSTILSLNEDITLRSNGDIYDELNLLTGYLTQRIDENNKVLAQVVVKSIDISTVDQDGNDTELSTFNDITYVTLSSEGLIPEAELKVAMKNEEDSDDMVYTLSEEFNTLYNTVEKPVESAILKGSTGYRDIDTGEFLETLNWYQLKCLF